MLAFGAEDVAERLPWLALIEAIEAIVVDPSATAPPRFVASVDVPDHSAASLLLKPGWTVGGVIAVKAVTFFPDNSATEHATVNAGVLLFDATNGLLLGACDGNELTTRRTAAASAVAAKRLARDDARSLLVVGSGALAPMVAQAHLAVRDYSTVAIWGRDGDKASAVVDRLRSGELTNREGAPVGVGVAENLNDAVAAADVITCVTGSRAPLVLGEHVATGTHVDLIGAFTPDMRETDDALIALAAIWVDTYEDGVLAGDLAQPLEAGVIGLDDIEGDLAELVSGPASARRCRDDITVFKSAGTALEDVAAARLVFSETG